MAALQKRARMITTSTLTRQPLDAALAGSWQWQLSQAITDPRELLRLLDLDPQQTVGPAMLAAEAFRLRVPRGFVRRMRRGDPCDPLLLQVLPGARELIQTPGFGADPLEERAAARAPGLLQKYFGRALLISTGACAVHCRYCFRREFPYAEADQRGRWRSALEAIAADPSLEEIILSGGDPLSLTDARLRQLTDALQAMPHIRRLRLHTRTPIVLPERIDSGFLSWLETLPWPTVIVLHANHANEIDAEVRDAASRLRMAGATLLNQSVLLAGINDSVEALEALSQALWSAQVLPYYLHLLDRVRGTAHFEVPEPQAQVIMAHLASRLPGFLVPRLVRESAGAPAKTIVASAPWDTLHSSGQFEC
jgi:EF-P beta-lysylation protein EpmB